MAKSRGSKQRAHFLIGKREEGRGWRGGWRECGEIPVGQDGWCLPLGHLSSMCLTGIREAHIHAHTHTHRALEMSSVHAHRHTLALPQELGWTEKSMPHTQLNEQIRDMYASG